VSHAGQQGLGCVGSVGCQACPPASHALATALLARRQVAFSLERVVAYMERLLDSRGHIVVCMAEGAGQVRPL
jgi:hypothetical protein